MLLPLRKPCRSPSFSYLVMPCNGWTALLDDLVGAGEQGLRNSKANGFRRLHIAVPSRASL